jgi:hypothetical protein
MALQSLFWILAAFSVQLTSSQAHYYTENNTNTEQTHAYNDALSGIRTHDPSLRAGEDSSCLTTRGHCDRLENV